MPRERDFQRDEHPEDDEQRVSIADFGPRGVLPPHNLDAATPDDAWEAAVAAEPGQPRLAGDVGLETIASGFADVADLKSRFLVGHSSGVARLAEAAGRQLGLAEPQVKRHHQVKEGGKRLAAA